jgi:Tol biopolymer transport system component
MDLERLRTQLRRILDSAAFADAERASSFLRFVVERALEGRSGEIKESVIAVEVLGRNASSFDSKTDPIVRVEAGRLRDRLNSYYHGAGEADRVLISLPKGGYVPEFSERQPPASSKRIDVLRFSILPPENASFESFAVSPDGRKLAFTAASGGKVMLWVRALDSLEAKPLAGTEHATYPFWSPDNRFIGFFIQNKLKTIEITGGPARDIADAVAGRGGTWSPDGIIVFSPRPLGVLCQVAATGGTPVPVTSLDGARGEIAHGFPQFLPDGRQFLYLASSCHPGDSCIRSGSLDSTTSKVIVIADASSTYAPVIPGERDCLLFVSHGALMSQRFNWKDLELSGERSVVVAEVRYRRWLQGGFSVSSNGLLLYQSGSAENQQFSWFDRQGKLLAEVGPRNNYGTFSLSPDERYVAVGRFEDPDTPYAKIWMMDLSREGAVLRLGDAGVEAAEMTPVWSPDSREIVFGCGDDRGMRLLRQALNGGASKCLLDTPGPKFPTDWSTDGRYIAYGSQWPDYRNLHTWILPLKGSDPEKPCPFLQHSCEELSAYFSPTEAKDAVPRWIAYTSNETGRHEVYVRDFPGGTFKWQVSTQGGFLPHWRHDGQELFYLAPDGTLMTVEVKPRATFEFDAPQPLFATGHHLMFYSFWMNQYAVGRGGQRFLINRPVSQAASSAITAVIPR